MKTALRVFAALVLLVLLLIVLSAAGLHLYLRTDHGDRLVFRTVNSLIPGRIRAEDANVSLLGQSVRLTDAVLLGPGGNVIAKSGEIRVEIDLVSLLNNRLVFNAISLKDPEIRLVVSGDGSQLNLVQAFVEESGGQEPEPEGQAGEGFVVVIEKLAMENGVVQYTDEAANLFARLTDVDAQASLDLSDLSGGVEGSVAQAFVSLGDRSLELDTVRIDSEYAEGGLDPLFVEASHNGFRVSARGEAADILTAPRVDVVVEYGGELSGLASLIQQEGRYSGRISGRVVAEGALGNPEATATVKYEGGNIAGVPLDGLQVEAALNDRIVEIEDSLLQIASGKATANGRIHLQEAFPAGFIESAPDLDAISYTMTATATGIDLTRLFPDSAAYPDSVSGQVELAGRGVVPPHITASSNYVLHMEGALPEFPVPVGEIDIRGEAGLDYPVLTYTTTGDITGSIEADIRGRLNLITNRVQTTVDLDVQQVERVAPALDMQAKGTLSARAEVTGTLGNPVASGTLAGENLQWQDYRVGNVSVDVRLDEAGMLNITDLVMNRAGRTLSVQGGVKVFQKGLTPDPDLPVSLDIRLESALIDRMIVQEGMGGTLDGEVHVGGNLTEPTVRVDLAGEDVTFQGINLGNIRVQGDLTDEGIQTQPSRPVGMKSGPVQTTGPAAVDSPADEAGIPGARPVQVDSPSRPLLQDGKDGPDSRQRKGPGFALGFMPLTDHALDDPAGRRTGAHPVRDRGHGASGLVSGGGEDAGPGHAPERTPGARAVQFNPQLQFEITGEKINLQEFTSLAQGTLRYDARLRGSLREPRGTFQVSGTGISIAGQAVQEVRASGDIRGRKVLIRSLAAVVAEGQTITGSGSIDLGETRAYDISLTTTGIMLDSLTAFRKSQVTGGRLVFNLSGNGTLENPQLQGTLRVVSPAVAGQVLEDITLNLELAGTVVDITGQNDFAVDGTYNLSTRVIDLEAVFEDTELAPYFAIAGRPELGGMISGSVSVAGDVSDPDDLNASLNVARAYVRFGERELMSIRSLQARYRQGNLIIPESYIDLPGEGSMLVRADAAPQGELDFHARGMIPLQIMALFDQALADLTGAARFEVDAAGLIRSPRVEADLYLEEVRYPIDYNNQLVHDLNGHVQMDEEGVVIENLSGRLDDGYFELKGRMDLEDLQPGRINLTARVRSLPVIVPDTMDLLIEGEAALTGMPGDSLLQADVAILEALYYQDLQLNIVAEVGERVFGGGREVQITQEPINLPYLRNAELDISIVRRGPVLVENNLAELSISPDLQISGTLNDPVITGRVAVIEGTITYQRRTFEVTEGVLEFTDPYRTRAVVDLQAEGEIRDWMVFISVTGPLDNLNIELASDPPAEDAVILTLLATGKTPDELTGGGGAPRSPSSMLAELLANTYGEELRETTGLDIFELETVSPGEGAADDIRITVGEELTRRLTVKYSLETSESEMTRTAIAEYKLLENLMINGFQDSEGVFGADLRYRIEFR